MRYLLEKFFIKPTLFTKKAKKKRKTLKMQTGAASHLYFLIISTILPLGQLPAFIYHRYVMNAKLIIFYAIDMVRK